MLASGSAALVTGLAGCALLPGNGRIFADTPEHVAVAAEWNAIRARLWDALALGLAGENEAGADVTQNVFVRFEEAYGEYGAHEMLEETNDDHYEAFEEAVGNLRSDGLEAGDIERTREAALRADSKLAEAQAELAGDGIAAIFELHLLGGCLQNATLLAALEEFEAARKTAELVRNRFDDGDVSDHLSAGDSDAFETFDRAIIAVTGAAENDDAESVTWNADRAETAAIEASYTLAGAEGIAGAAHLSTLQARGWDATVLAAVGGPSTAFAHATALTNYRARIHDCRWLAEGGEREAARTWVTETFAHFEQAEAHEAIEEADHDAYETFEDGLEELQAALEGEQADTAEETVSVEEAVGKIDSALVSGIESLAGSFAPLLGSAFFRARLADAHERYRMGDHDVARAITQEVFERFEANELDVHEQIEEQSEDLYHEFEEEHLDGLTEAYETASDDDVETHAEGVQQSLIQYEAGTGIPVASSGAQAAFTAARGFDAAALDVLGAPERAAVIGQEVFEQFEANVGEFHETIEHADHSAYEHLEDQLEAVIAAVEQGEAVYPIAKELDDAVRAAMAQIVGDGGGGDTNPAETMREAYAQFEESRVHELVEDAGYSAYEIYEHQLEAFIEALETRRNVTDAAELFAQASLYAQFAVVGSVDVAPLRLRLSGADAGAGHRDYADAEGGPNVVEGIPDDADHVVDMTATDFEPETIRISQGDTVAWKFVDGEPHSVTAYEDGIPEEAEYWASGAFDSQEAAETGWENMKGYILPGESYVHTFETPGTHEYYCIPHETVNMIGEVIVE